MMNCYPKKIFRFATQNKKHRSVSEAGEDEFVDLAFVQVAPLPRPLCCGLCHGAITGAITMAEAMATAALQQAQSQGPMAGLLGCRQISVVFSHMACVTAMVGIRWHDEKKQKENCLVGGGLSLNLIY